MRNGRGWGHLDRGAEGDGWVSDQDAERRFGRRLTRRATVAAGLALATGGVPADGRAHGHAAPIPQASPAAGATGDQAATIVGLARDAMAQNDLKAVIVRVTIDGVDVVTEALGESMTGVPATPEMHF